MVCKEEVLSWFKDLESYKRIDVLYNLLNMCLPFELRFLGSCVEEIGKHTYQELRGPAITANDFEKLSKDVTFNQGLIEENVRHRVLLYLSLLSSRNYSVANFLYKNLLRTEHVEDIVKGHVKDELLQSETLLLFTMALYHPAFTFEQKQYFGSILSRLIEFSDSKTRIAPKPSVYGYPPGFGYPTNKKSAPEILSSMPVKSAPTMCYSDSTLQQQPPGLPHLPPQPPMEFMWNTRPGFHCAGAPEVPPFPPPSISPQVSQQGSPSHSRSTSPLRTQQMPPPARPPPPLPPIISQPPPCVVPPTVVSPPGVPPIPQGLAVTGPPVECLPPPPNLPPPPPQQPALAQIQIDSLLQSSLPLFQTEVKSGDEEHPSGPEEKHLRDHMWHPPQYMQNGIRYPFYRKVKPFLAEHMEALSLDGENSLHQSNSSSNSSPNQTPPGTPSNTPSVTPHGPGRGNECKLRNGIPNFGPPMCDATSPPPPPYSNCTVPYNYAQFPANSPYPPRTPPGCYNCGAAGHAGTDCTIQNIEEITQKKNYQLDYSPITPDTDK